MGGLTCALALPLPLGDNRSTLHAPSHFDAAHQRRLMWRITIEGGADEQIAPSPQALRVRVQAAEAGAGQHGSGARL
eukprot:COSAG01_NODE_5627_length_4134_cov_3.733086_2_plen_77_part_00